MAERIFPTQPRTQLGSKLEFNGIDIDTVLTKLAEAEDDSKKSVLSPELREQIANMKLDIVTSEDDDENEVVAKKAIPEAFKEHMFKAKDDKGEDEEKEDGDEETKEEVVEGKKAARTRKIRFTSASQLSPDAVEAAKAAGDEELHRAILAARSDIRAREAKKLLDLSEEALKKEAAAATKRQAYRMTVVENAEETKKALAKVSKDSGVFKTVKSMTDDERNYFRRIALDRGMPEEYVESMFNTTVEASQNEAETSIRDIMSSELNESTKKAAISGLVKTAVLDNENISRLKKYWKDELGYGDEEWIDDLFTTKYNS